MIEASKGPAAERPDTDWHQVVSEHAGLAERAEHLETALKALAANPWDSSEDPGAQGLLEEFRIHLRIHLASEERSGVLELAGDAEPRFARRIERLRSEHDELRALVDGLVGEAGGTRWTRIHAGFVSFRRVLRLHEQAENEILLSAYLDDLGGRG